jgi:hypothetical protein
MCGISHSAACISTTVRSAADHHPPLCDCLRCRTQLVGSYCQLLSQALPAPTAGPTPPTASAGPKLPSSAATIITSALRQLADTCSPAAGRASAGSTAATAQQQVLQALVALLPAALPQLPAHERAATLTFLAALVSSTAAAGTRAQAAAGLAACCSSKPDQPLSTDEQGTLVGSIAAALQAAAGSGPSVADAAATQLLSALLRAINTAIAEGIKAWPAHLGTLMEPLRQLLLYGTSSSASSSSSPASDRPAAGWSKPSAAVEQASSSSSPGGRPSNSGGRYQPPHLRRASRQTDPDSLSDSDASDSESAGGGDRLKTWRVRLSVLLLLQSIAKADAKALHSYWTSLLASQPLVQHKPQAATLACVMLHDPVPKVRLGPVWPCPSHSTQQACHRDDSHTSAHTRVQFCYA